MRKNGRLFIILGVGLACLAVALAFLMFQNAGQSQAVEKAPVTVKVVTVTKDIPAHQKFVEADLGEETVDKDLLTGGEAFAKSEVLGSAPKVGLIKGQRIKKGDLETGGLSNDIAPGKRAVTIPADKLNQAAGLLRDSDHIDLVFSTKVTLSYVLPTRPLEIDTATAAEAEIKPILPVSPPGEPSAYPYPGEPGSRFKIQGQGGKGDPVSKVILQDIKVLRVVAAPTQQQGQQQQQQQQAAAQTDMLILELTNEQAEVMKFILDNGATYSFAVRGKDDHEPVQSSGITFDVLITNYQLPTPKSVRLPGETRP
ncbi:MAG TPA: Flp pilus assembly protein CpaB [Thermomicrobiales bacterium]|jgi:Flp pilus assembly protein CpaB